MAQKKTLEILPEVGTESVVVVPTSATSLDGRAKKFAVRDDTGASLLTVDAEAQTATVGVPLTAATLSVTTLTSGGASVAMGVPLVIKSMTETARDALTPVTGMIVFNTDASAFNVYTGATWKSLVVE